MSVLTRCLGPRLLLLLMAALQLVAVSRAAQYMHCDHTDDMDDVLPGVHLPTSSHSQHKRSLAAADQSLRISVHYDSSFSTGLSANLRTRLQITVIPKMVTFFEQALKVRSLQGGPIILDRRCDGSFFIPTTPVRRCVTVCQPTNMCGPATIPTDHLKACTQCNGQGSNSCETIGSDGAGVSNAEFVLYISALQTTSCGSTTLAFAGGCEMEDMYDRPIAGFTNFCPNGLSADNSDDYILTVAKHELLHALGFSRGLYRFWRNSTGHPRTPRDNFNIPISSGVFGADPSTVQTVTYNNWQTRTGAVTHTVTQLVTPRIVEEGRLHFNCPSLTGVEVENQGGSGTSGSHWEARIVENEVMTGVISPNAPFSRLTFALLEDSGWYMPDYSMAQQLVWGRNTGCSLAAGSCGGYIQSQQNQNAPIAPFCNRLSGSSASGCTNDRLARSSCNLVQFTSALPSQYQYFNSGVNFNSGTSGVTLSNVGGSLSVTDYCPYQRGFSNGDCSDPANSPGTGTNNIFGQTYAEGSRCFNHDGQWRVTVLSSGSTFTASGAGPVGGCYQYSCSNGQVIVRVQGTAYTCTSTGQQITVDVTSGGFRYRGSIICPSCLEICYDDFVNCPAAASVYSEFVSTSSAIAQPISSTVAMPVSTTPIPPVSTTPIPPVSTTPVPVVLPVSTTPVPVVLPVSTTPVPVVLPVSTTPVPVVLPVSTTPVPVVLPVSTTPVPVALPVSTTPVPVALPVSTTPVPVALPVSTTPVPVVLPVSTTPVPVVLPVSTTPVPVHSSTPVPVAPSSTIIMQQPESSSPPAGGQSSSSTVKPSPTMDMSGSGDDTDEPTSGASCLTHLTSVLLIMVAMAAFIM